MRKILSLSFLLLMASGIAVAGEWGGSRSTVDGVEVVHNPSEPMDSPLEIQPELLFSLGGDSEEVEQLFGAVIDVEVDEEGNSYLLDLQFAEIRIFGPQGEYLRTIGRKGGGPGEFGMAGDLFFLPGNRVGVSQRMPSRIAVMDREGLAMDDFPVPGDGGFTMVEEAVSAGSKLVLNQLSMAFNDGEMSNTTKILAIDAAGEIVATLDEQTQVRTGNTVVAGRAEDVPTPWTASPAGQVFLSLDYYSYEIDVRNVDGSLERKVRRDYESLEKTEEEMDPANQNVRVVSMGSAPDIEYDIEPMRRDIENLYARDNGELWVRTSRGFDRDAENTLGEFDVFDAEGRFARTARINLDYDNDEDQWFFRGDRLYVVKQAQGAMMSAMNSFGGIRMERGDDEEEDEDEEPAPLEVRVYQLDYATHSSP